MGNSLDHDLAMSIDAYYAGEDRAGIRACERALSKSPPFHVENNIRQNYIFYMPNLSDLEGVSLIDLNIPPYNPGWGVFNPTLISKDGGHWVLIRSANYEIVNGKYDIKESSNGTIYTRYQLVELDDKDQIKSIEKIESEPYEKSGFPADGIEDIRIFQIKDKFMLSGTIRNMVPYTDKARIALADFDIKEKRIYNLKLFDSPVSADKHEKNWMPILGTQEPEWLYECNNDGWTDVVGWNGTQLNLISRHKAPSISSSFRGGGQLVKVGDHYYAVIHEIVILHDGRRNYVHRFVKFNSRMGIEDFSIPFFLKHKHTIEFVSGFAFNENTEEFRVTFGFMDKEAWMVKFSLSFLKEFMDIRHEVLGEKVSLF